jgi:hypothetical protein
LTSPPETNSTTQQTNQTRSPAPEAAMQIGPRTVIFHSPDSHTLWDRHIDGTTYRFMVVHDSKGQLQAAAWRVDRRNSLTVAHQWRH